MGGSWKLRHALDCAALVATALIFVGHAAATGPDGWTDYLDPEGGFRVRYPSEWARDTPAPGTTRLWSRSDYADFVLQDSGGLRQGIFTVTIAASRMAPGTTLDTHAPRLVLLKSAERAATTEVIVAGTHARQDRLINAGPFGRLIVTYVAHKGTVYTIALDYTAAPSPETAIALYERVTASFAFTP